MHPLPPYFDVVRDISNPYRLCRTLVDYARTLSIGRATGSTLGIQSGGSSRGEAVRQLPIVKMICDICHRVFREPPQYRATYESRSVDFLCRTTGQNNRLAQTP